MADELPPDITSDEKRYFELTGSMLLYEERKKADAVIRERTRLTNEIAERKRLEEHLAASREQNARAEGELAALRSRNEGLKAIGAPNPDEDPMMRLYGVLTGKQLERKPIAGSEALPQKAGLVLNRIFMEGTGWAGNEEAQKALVDVLLNMDHGARARWLVEMEQAIAGGVYSGSELSPRALMRGFTGLRAIAGDAFDALSAKAIGGSTEGGKPDKSAEKPKDGGKKGKKGIVNVKATRINDDAGASEDVDGSAFDDSPASPWGDGEYSY